MDLKKSEPDLPFGQVGKKLGELWQGVSESDKAVRGLVLPFAIGLPLSQPTARAASAPRTLAARAARQRVARSQRADARPAGPCFSARVSALLAAAAPHADRFAACRSTPRWRRRRRPATRKRRPRACGMVSRARGFSFALSFQLQGRWRRRVVLD